MAANEQTGSGASNPPTRTRAAAWDRIKGGPGFDMIVIGGGITGAGVALEASRRGLRTLLVEQKDFAWGSSSRSSKMVHGGLRYLASGQLRLARESVRERERLLQELPGLVEPLQFVMPHYRGRFPGPRVLGAVLWAYDRLAGRHNHEFYRGDSVLQWVPGINRHRLLGGSRFADAVTDDARLVLRVLQEARAEGALTLNYVRAKTVRRSANMVSGVELEDIETGAQLIINAPLVVNATGAWTDHMLTQPGQQGVMRPLRGSHLVVPSWRLPVACAVSLMHPADGRPVFVFPWEGVTVIGTTDLDHRQDLRDEARISEQEVEYLLAIVPQIFPGLTVRREHVQSTWAGVRPVVRTRQNDPATKASREKREHVLWDDQGLISVAGGKLTTFRPIALEVLAKAKPYLTDKPDHSVCDVDPLFPPAPRHIDRPAGVSGTTWRRLKGRYGRVLPHVMNAGSLHPVAGTGTLWAELGWAVSGEDVVHLDDLMLRRTRLGILLPEGGREILPALRPLCQKALSWDDSRWVREEARYLQLWGAHYSLPGSPGADEKS